MATYPGSSDVTSGQATAATQFNQLRADALRLGQAVADSLNLGAVFARYSNWVRPQYLATNKIRVPYSATRPPSLIVNGYLLMATANVDLAAAPSGAAARYYIFANRAAASTTFTITVSTSATEGTDQRLIGEFYWDGANIDQGSIRAEELEAPGYIQIATDAEKSTSPAAGDWYIATDTSRIYACFVAGTWVLVAGAKASVRAYHNADQSISNATVTAVLLNSERFDTDAQHDTSSNTSRLTCQIAGKYMIGGSNYWQTSAGGNRRITQIRLNGATIIGSDEQGPYSATTENQQAVTTFYQLAVGDYVEMVVFQDSGGGLNSKSVANTAPEFWMFRVGP